MTSPTAEATTTGAGASSPLRQLILERIQVIRTTFGQDQFKTSTRGARRKKPPPPKPAEWAGWTADFDFATLSDAELVEQFERVVWRCYRQR